MKTIFCSLLIAFVALFNSMLYGQNPTYVLSLRNDILVSPTVYEFDIFLQRTGDVELYYSIASQYFINYNAAIVNGGVLSFTFVPGTCELLSNQQIDPVKVSLTPDQYRLNCAAHTPSKPATVISNVAPGTKIGRFRITNTVAFGNAPANLTWSTGSQKPKVFCYLNDASTGSEVTNTDYHTTADLNNLPLPVELSSFTALTNQRDINLNWETKTEVNSSLFQLERRAQNTLSWEKIGEVTASGNSNSPKVYSYTDKKVNSGKYNYRLKVIDNDGTFEYSKEVESEVQLPKGYAISQNYPNPFNPTTRIDYQLPFDSKVTIDLYGITGERVTTLINSEVLAGYYSVDINTVALNLASGVYIYRITAQNQKEKSFVQVKKLMLTK